MDWFIVRYFKYNKFGLTANECKNKLKDKAYIASESKYETLLKQTVGNKQNGSSTLTFDDIYPLLDLSWSVIPCYLLKIS